MQNAIKLLSSVPINSAPASSASRLIASEVLENPGIASQIAAQLPPEALNSPNFPWLQNAFADFMKANNTAASNLASGESIFDASLARGATQAAAAEGEAAATGAAEALAAGAGETAALGAGETAAAGAGAAGTAGTGLGLSSVLPAAAAGAAGYVGGRLANAGIGAGLRATGADVSQGAENASGWGDLSLGSWLGGLAGQGVQQGQRTNQRGIQSSAESQINPANQMGEIGDAINKANADMQQFRQEFERQTAEIRRQMQSLTANTATPKAAVSTPRSSTSTTGTK